MKNANEKQIGKDLKELSKIVSSQKPSADIEQFFNTFMPNFKILVVSQDTSKQNLPRNSKKIIMEYFTILNNATFQYNASFINDSFIFEFNQIISIITAFIKEQELIDISWKTTFQLMSLSVNNLPFSKWENSITSFFNSFEPYSFDLFKDLTEKIKETSYESICQWWRVFVRVILPQYVNFPMVDPPVNQTKDKKLSKQLLFLFLPFVSICVAYKPFVPIFTSDNIDSCFAIILFLQQVIYDVGDNENTQTFIHACCENFFQININPDLPSENVNPYSFYKCREHITEEEHDQYLSIIRKLYSQSKETIGCLVVLLLKDIEYLFNNQKYYECGYSIFRFHFLISILIENGLTTDDLVIVSGAFFFVAARNQCIQLYRLFAEFTVMMCDITPEAWKYLKTSEENQEVKYTLLQFISQVVISSAEIIFNDKISNFDLPSQFIQREPISDPQENLPNDEIEKTVNVDPISLNRILMSKNEFFLIPNSQIKRKPFFGPLDFLNWTYQKFEKYFIGLFSVFPFRDDIDYIASFSETLDKLSEIAPYNKESNISLICHRIIGMLRPEVLSDKGLFAASRLLKNCSTITVQERNLWIDYLISKLPNHSTFDIIANIALSKPLYPNSSSILFKTSEAATKSGYKIDNIGMLNLLHSTFSFIDEEIIDSSIEEPIIALILQCYDELSPDMYLSLAISRLLYNIDDSIALSLFDKSIEHSSPETLSIISSISTKYPFFFKQNTEVLNKLFATAKTFMNDSFAFSKLLKMLEDCCVSSKLLSSFWDFITNIKSNDIRVNQLLKTFKYTIFESFSNIEWGKHIDGDQIIINRSEDQKSFTIEQNHLLGTSKVKITPILPKQSEPEQILIENTPVENQEKCQPESDLIQEEFQMRETLEKLLQNIPDFKLCNPSDFTFSEEEMISKEDDNSDSQSNENNVDEIEIPVNETNSFLECLKEFSPQQVLSGKSAFERFTVDIFVPNISEEQDIHHMDHLNEFCSLLGSVQKDSDGNTEIHFTTYRFEVVYRIRDSIDKCDSNIVYVWEEKSVEGTFGQGKCFVYLKADLYPIIIVKSPTHIGLFEGVCAYCAPILASLLHFTPSLTEIHTNDIFIV